MASESDLRNYYQSRCAAASVQGSSLILSVPCGLGADCVAINLELTKQAMLNKASAFHCKAAGDLFLGSVLSRKLAPHMEPYTEESENTMAIPESIMRNGYARDRVIACNKVKQALLNQGKVGATEEFLNKQQLEIDYIKKWFAQAEENLAEIKEVSKPSAAILTKRTAWTRALEIDPDALHNQVTFLQATAVQGYTSAEIEALALDPKFTDDATLRVAFEELTQANVQLRDRHLGTETFVSFTFPPGAHELLVAAAAHEGAMARDDGSVSHTALVTFHSPTGEVMDLTMAANDAPAPNSLITGDAAQLLAQLHTLARGAQRKCILLEHK